MPLPPNLQRELEYHEKLYSGFAQQHFHQAAVRAFREHLAAHILHATGAGPASRLLSIGCGIGDTELLLAPHVGEVTGIDLSPSAIAAAQEAARQTGFPNAVFRESAYEEMAGCTFDVVIAIFFLHHLSDATLAGFPARLRQLLAPGGVFYSLDPSRYRLSGAVGNLLFPSLMKKYQTEDERELSPGATGAMFMGAGYSTQVTYYDFVSTPLAGLAPGWLAGYRVSRWMDDILTGVPGLRALSSNFEIIARLPA